MIISPNHLMSMNWQRACQAFCGVKKQFKYSSYTIIFAVLLTPFAFTGEVTYENALELKKNGQYAKAASYWHQLLMQDKHNAEYWFQLGLVQRFQRQNELARQSQEKALLLAPENHDIRLELARLHSWQKNYELAASMVQEVLAAHPDYQDALDLAASITRAQDAPPDPGLFKWQMDFGYEHSHLSRRPQPDWHHYFLQLGHWVREDTFVHIRAEKLERFNTYNEHYEIGLAHIFNDTYNAYFSVGYTPDSVFIPEWRMKIGGEARIIFDHEYSGNTWLTAHVQHDRYKNLDISVIKPGIRYQFLEDWQVHLQHINVIDENDDHLTGWSVRLDWQTPLDGLRVFAGMSDAPETENATTINTRGRFAGFSYQFTPRLTLHTSYAREKRENSFIRDIVAVAISVKF